MIRNILGGAFAAGDAVAACGCGCGCGGRGTDYHDGLSDGCSDQVNSVANQMDQ